MRNVLATCAAAMAVAGATCFAPAPAQAWGYRHYGHVYYRAYAWAYRPYYAYAYAHRPVYTYAYVYRPYAYTYAYRPYAYAYGYRPYYAYAYRPYAYRAYAYAGYGRPLWLGWRRRWW